MAIEFARVRYVKRSDGGNVCRTAAYNAREDVRSERTGERFYFAHRDGLLDHQMLLPEGAAERFQDAEVLWNAAQAAEKRKDAQEARELLLALPSDPGLSIDDWRVLTEEFARAHFVGKGVAVQIDIHAPHEGERNVHAHLLITTRRLEGESFSAGKARDLDPAVRMAKNGKPIVAEGDAWGVIWREAQNAYFEWQGLDLRVDETGVVAQHHEGPVRLRTVPKAAEARAAASDAENDTASRDPEQVLAAITRRRATFTELDIERQLLKPVPDAAERAALRAEILARSDIVALHERGTGEFAGRYTTQTVREEEAALLTNAAAIARNTRPVAARHVAAAAARRTLDDEQHTAFLRATGTDGLVVIEGIAGAGKSYSVEAIREAHERDGWRVIGLAPTNTVAEDLRRGGFAHGSTVHLELYYQESGRHDRAPAWNRRTCVVVDEAAMLDTRTFGRLMAQAAAAKAKVVLVGDDRQLASIERGGMFTAVKEQHGSAVIAKVRRQEADWQRTASEDFASGQVAEGLRAYAEHDCLVWSDSLDEARSRLLSDWDWDSRERPEVSRFIYASTNAEVNRLNQDIRDIRQRRGEVGEGLTVETTRGEFKFGVGDRLQFFANDRKAGFYNGTLGTVTSVDGHALAVETDNGRTVRVNTAEFKQFGLGYAGTVYRGQGKTQTEVSALYDNAFSWNARTAYVGMTRHKESVKLYVPTNLARDELALGRQMGKRQRDEASLAYATAAEVVDFATVRRQQAERHYRAPGEPSAPGEQDARQASQTPAPRPGPEWGGRMPQAEVAALRQVDMTAYARDMHGYAVTPDPTREHHYRATRPAADGSIELLEIRYVPGGHWTFRNPANARDRGDILDLAQREGAVSLAAARAEIAAYQAERSAAMREPENRRRRIDETPMPTIDPNDPDATARQASADEQRRRDIIGAEDSDRQDAIAIEAEQRQQAARDAEVRQEQSRKEEAAKQDRLDTERRQAGELEQGRLHAMQQTRPADHDSFVAYSGQRAEQARQETGIRGPEDLARARTQPSADPDSYPASASLRYTESLARHYDGRDPYGSLGRASLAESAQFQREQYELNRQIAQEGDPARRDMLTARRDIEHNDYMGQAYERIAGQTQAITGNSDHPDVKAARDKAAEFRNTAQQARGEWAERSVDQSGLYPPLNEQMRGQVDAARQAKERQEAAAPAPPSPTPSRAPPPGQPAPPTAEGRVLPDPDRERTPSPSQPSNPVRPTPEPSRESPTQQAQGEAPLREAEPAQRQPEQEGETPPRSAAEETRLMEQMNLPAYAAQKHGYAVEWKDEAKESRAILHKGSEELRAAKREDGSWAYANRHDANDRGDIVDFEAQRGAGTRSNARDQIRPELERSKACDPTPQRPVEAEQEGVTDRDTSPTQAASRSKDEPSAGPAEPAKRQASWKDRWTSHTEKTKIPDPPPPDDAPTAAKGRSR